jgi:hypothetical protein
MHCKHTPSVCIFPTRISGGRVIVFPLNFVELRSFLFLEKIDDANLMELSLWLRKVLSFASVLCFVPTRKKNVLFQNPSRRSQLKTSKTIKKFICELYLRMYPTLIPPAQTLQLLSG